MEILQIAISNGIFCGLFVWLLIYQLRDSEKREKKYIDIIAKLNNHIDVIDEIKKDTSDIKISILEKKRIRK